MKVDEYVKLRRQLIARGYTDEIAWAEGIKNCTSAEVFRDEYCWVVLNSGMKEQIARGIWTKVRAAKVANQSASTVFGHKQKAAAIDAAWKFPDTRFNLWRERNEQERLKYLRTLPFIGKITIYHFAKNLGMDVAKPDRHLVRIALKSNETVDQMCKRLALATGHRVAVVDTVIWRAANLGLV